MAINERKLVSGKIRYEARLFRKGMRNRCMRFDTRAEAEERIKLWDREKQQKVRPKVDIIPLWNKFCLGGVR